MGIKVTCPYCNKDASLVKGDQIYPHRPDLYRLNFWSCPPCDAYVGCHKPNKKLGFCGHEPLGRLANAELRGWKSLAHKSFDKVWKSGRIRRKDAYKMLSQRMGKKIEETHIGMFNIEECARVVEIVKKEEALINEYGSKKTI